MPEAMIGLFVKELNAKLADEYQSQKTEIARLRAENEKLREALFGLNASIDDFWNDEQRPPLHQMRSTSVEAISTWQAKARAALAETETKDGD